jgi:hypothetical protein
MSSTLALLVMALLAFSWFVPLAYVNRRSDPTRTKRGLTTEQQEEFFAMTEGLSTEFRADLELNLVESQPPSTRSHYQRRLEYLYSDLNHVRYRFPESYAASGPMTLERMLASAFIYTKLDELSLQLRVLRAASPVRPRWAARQLEELQLRIPRIGCNEALAPDLSGYYDGLRDLIFSGRGESSVANIAWLEENIKQMTSPLQLPAVAGLLARLSVPQGHFDSLLLQYESTLNKLGASDRELGQITASHLLTTSTRNLLESTANKGIGTTGLLSSYRQFILNSSEEAACSDSTVSWQSIVEDYNQLLVAFHANEAVPALSLNDIQTHSYNGGGASERPLPDASASEALLSKMYQLRIRKPDSFDLSDNASESTWESYTTDFLRSTGQIDPRTAACSDCAYFQKTKLLLSGFDLVAPVALKLRLLRALVDSLEHSSLQTSDPELWAFQAKLVLNLARNTTRAQNDQLNDMRASGVFIPLAPSPMGTEIRQYLEESNAVLQAYAKADELFNNRFSAPYLP